MQSLPISGPERSRVPSTGRPTPLIPDCWLARGSYNAALRLHPNMETGEIGLEIVEGEERPKLGRSQRTSVVRVKSIWTGETFNGDYIERQASQAILVKCCSPSRSLDREFGTDRSESRLKQISR